MSTREDILEAANVVYAELGYDGLSLRAVAKMVGITPMAIYRHFKDKDDLMHHVVLHGLAIWQASLESLHEVSEPWERIRQMGRVYVRFSEEHRTHFEVVFLSTDRLGHLKHLTKEGAERFERSFLLYVSWVAECLGERATGEDVRDVAIDIWAYSHGLLALQLAGRLAFLNVEFSEFHASKLSQFLEQKKKEFHS